MSLIKQDAGPVSSNNIQAALYLRDWVSRIVNHTGKKQCLINHNRLSAEDAYLLFKRKQKGAWCGGVATFYSQVLSAYAIPHILYGYWYRHEELSHLTTAIWYKSDFYLIDAYLGYHYGVAEKVLTSFSRVLNLVSQEQYSQVDVVTVPVRRDLVTPPNTGGIAGSWVYPNTDPQPYEKRDNLWLYAGAQPTLSNLMTKSPFRDLMDEYRGKLTPREFSLESLRHNARILPSGLDTAGLLKAKGLLKYIESGVVEDEG